MTDIELLVALAQTPLGFAMGLPLAALIVAGLHHIWATRPVTAADVRMMRAKRRAKRVTARKAQFVNNPINK